MVIDPDYVAQMHDLLPAQTRDVINDTFGISANTWNKIKVGAPIRASVAQRLIDRLNNQTQHSN